LVSEQVVGARCEKSPLSGREGGGDQLVTGSSDGCISAGPL
jgi:hypothetical protein